MSEFFRNPINVLFIVIIILMGLGFFYICVSEFKRIRKYGKETRRIIEGVNSNDQAIKITEKQIKKRRRKEFFLKKFYREYMFFGGKKTKFFRNIILGFVITFMVLYIISKEPIISLCLSLSFFIMFYIKVDKKLEKKRKKYIKGFVLALRTLTATTEAGNSFEEGLKQVSTRETINPKIREEFALMSNHLKSGKSLDETLEEFYKRNSMFPEFSMFVIIMQFYSKKGGSGLHKILLDLETTLSRKMESYDEIDTELGIHKTLMNCCIYAYFLVLLLMPIFSPSFYVELANDQLGVVKALVSVALLLGASVFYKSMVRNCAEG